MDTQKPIAVLGAGSWGTALSLYLSRRGQEVRVWSVDGSEIAAMLADRANNRFMPGFTLPETFLPIANLEETVKGINDLLIVVPSVGFRDTLKAVKPFLTKGARLTCATKGLDANTGELLNNVVEEVLGKDQSYAVLSGPSFAREVASGMPTAVMIASRDKNLLADLTKRFESPIFHVYPSDDVVGVEVGGVAKNVIAIATGMSDGMGYGANARSAIITYGLNEIIRLGTFLGGKLETMIGLSGMGDLILTCTDDQSRNRRLGLSLGKGADIQAAEKEIGQVVEGKRNAELVTHLAKKHNIDMPICTTVWDILQGKLSAKDGMAKILGA